MKDDFGNVLKKFRERAGMTQRVLAENLNLSIDVVKNWEYNKSKIPANIIDEICKVLKISINEFYGVDDFSKKHDIFFKNKKYIYDSEDVAQKYYALDDHGKEAVKTLLDIEYKRVTENT